MSEGLVNKVVDRAAVEQDVKYIIDKFGTVERAIEDINKNGIRIEVALKSTDSLAELITLSRELKGVNDDLLKSGRALAEINKINAQAEKERAYAIKATNTEAAKASKYNRDQYGEYGILIKSYNEARSKALNYALALGANHPITQQAIADARSLRDALNKVEGAVALSSKAVTGYNSVGGQFNQLLRELPNLAQSPVIFIQALSNNITYFVEAVQVARKEGQSFKEIMGTIGQSAFGLVGLLNIAITAFIFLANAMLKSDKAGQTVKQTYDEITKSIEDLVEAEQKYLEGLQNSAGTGERNAKRELDLAQARSDGSVKSLKAIEDAEKSLYAVQKTNIGNRIKEYNQLIELNANGKIFDPSVIDDKYIPQNLRKFLPEIEKAKKEKVDLEQFFQDKIQKLTEDANDLDTKTTVAHLKTQQKLKSEHVDDLSALEKKLNDDIAKSDRDRAKATLETDKETQDAIIHNEHYSLDERIAARWEYHNKVLGIYQLEAQAEYEKNEAENKYNIEQINKAKISVQKKNELLNKENERNLTEVIRINEQYTQNSLQSIGKYADDSLKDLGDTTAKETEIIKRNLKGLVDYFNQIPNIGNSESSKQHYEQLKKQFESIALIFNSFVDLGKSISTSLYDPIIAKQEEYKKNVDTALELEIARINATSKTQIEATNAIGVAQERATLKKADADRKEKKAAHDKAVLDKSINVAAIIGKTALAEIIAFTEGDPYTKVARAVAAGVEGAAALATALSAPIPGYFTGTESAAPGLGKVAEKGQELIIDRRGKVSLTPNHETIRMFQGGEKVIPADKTREILNSISYSTLNGYFAFQQREKTDRLLAAKYEEVSERTADRIVNAINKNSQKPSTNNSFFQSDYYHQTIKNR